MKKIFLIISLLIGPIALAESIEPTIIDSILKNGKGNATRWNFSQNDLFYQGSRIYGCQSLADNCEPMSQLICKKLGFSKVIEFSWSRPEEPTSNDFRARLKESYVWVLEKDEKGNLEFSQRLRAYMPENIFVFSGLTCSM